MSKLTIDQMPTAEPTSLALERGATDAERLVSPIAAPKALQTNWVLRAMTKPAMTKPAMIGP